MPEVEFYGEKFTLAGEFSEFALMEFAESVDDAEQNTARSMASMLRLVLDCIVPDDHKRFRDVARKNRAKADKVMAVLQAAMEAATDRPTGQPSDSSDGQESTDPKSETSVDARILAIAPNRPEIQAGLIDIQERQTG